MGFPFVASEVAAGRLRLHGIWKNIADGELESYDPAVDGFRPV